MLAKLSLSRVPLRFQYGKNNVHEIQLFLLVKINALKVIDPSLYLVANRLGASKFFCYAFFSPYTEESGVM